MQKTLVRIAVASILASVALFVVMTEDYWRDRYFKENAKTIQTRPGEVHVGFVRWNNRLLSESYDLVDNVCYLRDAASDEVFATVEQCNYSPPCDTK